eukprot:CAMPEP_0179065820 /NCGR_PEP_ID=MMETSP0796-20121207/28659_1 /TAXON_ID=73915 /ORGANISM="Pyrodinium bahamense, Strain pbaha01" /LENGTH=281 /DNA_ID=CAMNT_0020762807 /DNA_START=82 /DNA_END=927 /DNA_ORIENTATION=+
MAGEEPEPEAQEMRAITFSPGPLGLGVKSKSGFIIHVCAGQAGASGVQTGWRIHLIDGEPYFKDLLAQKVCGDKPYTVTFIGEEFPHAIEVIGAGCEQCNGVYEWIEADKRYEKIDGGALLQKTCRWGSNQGKLGIFTCNHEQRDGRPEVVLVQRYSNPNSDGFEHLKKLFRPWSTVPRPGAEAAGLDPAPEVHTARNKVVTCQAHRKDLKGLLVVICTDMAGTELADMRVEPDETGKTLRRLLALQLGVPFGLLWLLTPSGGVVEDYEEIAYALGAKVQL